MSDRESLQSERDFLLASLDDLEAEHAIGAIDDESYAQLRADYTARAAATIRALRDGIDARPDPPPPAPARRRLAIIAAVVVFALVAGGVLAAALGARLPGETASGNSQSRDEATANRLGRVIRSLEADVNADPDDYDARLALARAYEANGDLRSALEQTDNAITIDASRPQAHANAGRLLYLASEAISDRDTQAQFVARASAAFNAAIERDSEFADAYYFRAVLEAATAQLERAQADLQTYLMKAPDGPYAEDARDVLARVTSAIESTSTTVPGSP